MSQPEEIAKADPLDADPSLTGAPLNVRKASAWLTEQERSGAGRWRRFSAFLPLAVLFGGLASAGVVQDALHLTSLANWIALGGASLFLPALAGAIVYARPHAYATNLVDGYKKLQELGSPAPGATAASTPLDRMVARIEALAGDDRTEVRAAARKAREHAAWLQQELDQLATMVTGQPQADAALDAARERLEGDLARTQARVAELYASLVDLQSGGPVDDLRLATERIAAELEVDTKLASARRATKQRS